MTADDLPMAARWLATPEVQLWWGDEDEVVSLEDFDDPNVALWIVSLDGRPFAYVQDYDPHAWPGHPFAFLPRGSRGMDQFIGEPEMIGAGHGSALIRAHAERLFAEGAPAVAADPSPDNPRAIRAYEKAGFQRGPVQDTDWGRCLLMTRYRE